MGDTKECLKCGKEFKKSRSDYTVLCPACRKKPKAQRTVTLKPGGKQEVSPRGRTCTVRNAVSGACGKPAVYAFKSSTGEVFAECREHHR